MTRAAPCLLTLLLLLPVPALGQPDRFDLSRFAGTFEGEAYSGEPAKLVVEVKEDALVGTVEVAGQSLPVTLRPKPRTFWLEGTCGEGPRARPLKVGRKGLRTHVDFDFDGKRYDLVRQPPPSGRNPALGEVLTKAREAGALKALEGTRYFLAGGPKPVLTRFTLKLDDEGLDVEALSVNPFSAAKALQFRYGYDGRLVKLDEVDGDREDPAQNAGDRGVVVDGRLQVTADKGSGRPSVKGTTWLTDDTVVLPLILFLLPALPEHLPPQGFGAEVLQTYSRHNAKPWWLVPKDDGVHVVIESPRGPRPAFVARTKEAEGKRLLTLEMGPSVMNQIDEAQAKAHLAGLPPVGPIRAFRYEDRAINTLRHLGDAQQGYRAKAGRFAGSMKELIDAGHWAPNSGHPIWHLRGYEIEVYASKASWVAVATPTVEGPGRGRFLARDPDGKVWASKEPIPVEGGVLKTEGLERLDLDRRYHESPLR